MGGTGNTTVQNYYTTELGRSGIYELMIFLVFLVKYDGTTEASFSAKYAIR